jgi:phage tail P2-like protein
MTEKTSLLPPGSSKLERNLSIAFADIEDIPMPVRLMRRAATIPAALLAYLAWERSVDRWVDSWTEDVKRRAIANSFFVHRHKGTIGALRRVVEPLGYLLKVIEWWQLDPPGPRGTFQLEIGVLDQGITEDSYTELGRLIDGAKRLSQHMIGLSLSLEVRASMNIGVACYDGDELTVYPYTPTPVEITASASFGMAEHLIETTTVYPL